MIRIVEKKITLQDIFKLLILISILILIFIFVIRKDTVFYTKWKFMLDGLTATCVIIICFSVYKQIGISLFATTRRINQNLLEINKRSWTEPFIKLIDQYPESTMIIKSMFPQSNFTPDIPPNLDEIKLKNINFAWSQFFLQLMEDFLTTSSSFISGNYNSDKEWFVTFIQWMTSPILRKYWKHNRMNYGPDTQTFVDQILDASYKYEEKRKEIGRNLDKNEVLELAKNITYSPRL